MVDRPKRTGTKKGSGTEKDQATTAMAVCIAFGPVVGVTIGSLIGDTGVGIGIGMALAGGVGAIVYAWMREEGAE